MSASAAVLEKYDTELQGLQDNIDVLKRNALERGVDLTKAELETITKHQDRIDEINGQLTVLARNTDLPEDVKAKLRMARNAEPEPDPLKYRSAGHLMFDTVHAMFGSQHDAVDRDARKRYERMMDKVAVLERAAEHMGTTAEATTATAGGFGGLYVAPVVGPIVDVLPKATPFLSAIGKQRAPDALEFKRPRIVDAGFTSGVGTQALQKAELASAAFDLKNDTVSLSTVGGYLNLSQQLLSMTPEAWNIVITQLQRRVANKGELAAITALGGSDSQVNLAANETEPGVVLGVLFEAAAMVFAKTGELPTWLAVGPTGWARLGSLVDGEGRPIWPALGAAMSATEFASNGPLGLRFIVTPGITDGSLWMGNSLGLEAYSYPFPVLEAIEPSLLGRQVAVAEAIGFWRPTTDEGPAAGNGAVKIAPAGS